ncbi:MAG: FAD-dependent oxidoreductase, partial [Phycisphaerae bacterium]|nr:FAD-dependent oxidoreductase [Phycisphaerae bacterium]
MKRKMKRRDLLTTAPLVAAAMATSSSAAEPDGKTTAETITEPPRKTPVVHECDLCVIGGSCTGVFAAVAAARLGAKVA